MAREATFNFISEDHIGNKPRHDGIDYRVTVLVNKTSVKQPDGSTKAQVNYVLYFPKDVVFSYDLKGKRLKFYADEKHGKSIGWRVLDGVDTTLSELATGRIVKPMPNGAWTVSITKLVNHSKIKLNETRSKVPVRRYTTTEFMVPITYNYIEL